MSSNPYRVFSEVYDQDVHLQVPRAFFRTLRPLIRRHAGGAPLLDLGCGSGLLTAAIAASGTRVTGIDGSRAMLAHARRRCARFGKRVSLVQARLESFRVAEPAPLALASHDVLNHVPTGARLGRVLASIARALAPGGLFAFDTVTQRCFESYWSDNTHLLEGRLGDVIMSCDWDPAQKRGSVRIISYVQAGRGRFTRGETVLHEYLHTDEAITRSLVAAGFERVWSRPWSPWREQDAEARSLKRLWCAAKPGASRSSPRLGELGFRRVV